MPDTARNYGEKKSPTRTMNVKPEGGSVVKPPSDIVTVDMSWKEMWGGHFDLNPVRMRSMISVSNDLSSFTAHWNNRCAS